MPDYSNGKIYCIRSFQTDKIYIGSTTQTLAQRLGKHKVSYKLYLKGKAKYISANELLKYDDYYIELITLYSCSCKAELVAEEGKYIREWDCVNKQIPGRTKKQWNFDNRDKINEHKKQRYIVNRDKKLEYQKQYYYNNRDKQIEYQKQYSIDNKDKNKEKRKQYRINNREKINEQKKQKIICICSCKSTRSNFRRHIKSKNHKNLMSEFIKNFISH